MSAITPENLYALLPAIHRIRDDAQGGPLQALLALAAEQGAVVEADIERLLDNWFIETCDEWVVPYIGDLLGVRGLHALPTTAGFSQRARVANTLGYRRRKGTATMLEQLARDTTGWPARAVEFFQILGWNQNYNHIRPDTVRTPDLRRTNELELLNTALDTATHTVDVRRIALDRGRHNLPNVGLFLWRLQSYFIPGGTARPSVSRAGFYTFSPLRGKSGPDFFQDAPLFNRPQTETEITHLAEEINVPGPFRRRPLYDELETRRAILLAGGTPRGVWFGAKPVVEVSQQIVAGGAFVPVPVKNIRICHLGAGAVRPDPNDAAGNAILVGVDPVLGRLAWADTLPLPVAVKVGYAYGFSGDLGGGPYNRRDSVDAALALTAAPTWQVGVARESVPVATGQIHLTLADAIADWHAQSAGTIGIIAIMDSHTYAGDLSIKIPEASQLLIVAADWPAVPKPGGSKQRVLGQLNPVEVRPHLLGNITVNGTAPAASDSPGALALDGLLIEGSLTVGDTPGHLGLLRIAHCTLVPQLTSVPPKAPPIVPLAPSLKVASENSRLSIELIRSVCGQIVLPVTAPALTIEDSIIDAATGIAISADDSEVDVQNSTVLGSTKVRRLDAGNSIFTGLVNAARQQEGCVRFCFVPANSATGRRYRCQPDLALTDAESAAKDAGETFDATKEAAVRARVVPVFTAEDYGHPAYAQLANTCPLELRTGAEDGAEMGAFRFLQQPQREANLRASLDEYLRFGLEAGLIFST
jgi:hypothetical protein